MVEHQPAATQGSDEGDEMTREDIIRWAHEADREWDCDRDMFEWLEWFANLVAAAEREACIELTDSRCQCAWVIRARSN